MPGEGARGNFADLRVRVGQQRHHQAIAGGVVVRRELARGKRADTRMLALQQLAPLDVVGFAERQLLDDVQGILHDVGVIRLAQVLEHLTGDLIDRRPRVRQAFEADERIAADVAEIPRRRVFQQNLAGVGGADVADEQETRRQQAIVFFHALGGHELDHLPVQGGAILRSGISDVAADGLASFLDEFKIGIEQYIEDQLHRFAVVDPGENIDEHPFLLGVGPDKLVAEIGDIVTARAGDDGGGAQLGFGFRGLQQRQHVRDDGARADGFERFEHVTSQQLVRVFQGIAQRLDDRRLLRPQFGDDHRRRAPAHAVGALEHATD